MSKAADAIPSEKEITKVNSHEMGRTVNGTKANCFVVKKNVFDFHSHLSFRNKK